MLEIQVLTCDKHKKKGAPLNWLMESQPSHFDN
jgi:hypothetical protein